MPVQLSQGIQTAPSNAEEMLVLLPFRATSGKSEDVQRSSQKPLKWQSV